MTDRYMGVAVDNTVHFGEAVKESLFYIMAEAGPMINCDGVPLYYNDLFLRQELPGRVIAHISMDTINIFSCKSCQERNIR